MGPPNDASGWTSDALDAVPPGTLLPIQLFGEYDIVALPRNSFVPDRVTTFAARPMPSGADASRPLVFSCTSATVSSGSAEYPSQGLIAEVMSAPSISVDDETMPEPWT